jgi:hypothetical protein
MPSSQPKCSPKQAARTTSIVVRVPSYADRLEGKARSVGDFTFYVMWKDRTDMCDSVEYISNLRRDLRG